MIVIIDYGAGNLFSVKNALDFLGAKSFISSDPMEIKSADKLILPGVGAFPDAMDMLYQKKLIDVIKQEADKKPLLGICLGMQILFEEGLEFQKAKGLGLIEGKVDALVAPDMKIPHMGWNNIKKENESPLSYGIDEDEMVYFVHSYKAITPKENISLYTEYGQLVPGLVFKGNVFGCQFHPEKSGDVGLRILKNYIELKS